MLSAPTNVRDNAAEHDFDLRVEIGIPFVSTGARGEAVRPTAPQGRARRDFAEGAICKAATIRGGAFIRLTGTRPRSGLVLTNSPENERAQ